MSSDTNKSTEAKKASSAPSTKTATPDKSAASSKTTATASAAKANTTKADTSKSSKLPAFLNNKPNLIIVSILGALVVILIIVLCITLPIITSGDSNDNKAVSGSHSSSANKDDDNKEPAVADGTLTIGDLSLKYPTANWKKDSTGNSYSTALSDKKGEYYLAIAYIESGDTGYNTVEYGEAIIETQTDLGYKIQKKLSPETINGKTWQRAILSGDDAWMHLLFYVDGDDYYMLTLATSVTGEKLATDVESIIQSISIK